MTQRQVGGLLMPRESEVFELLIEEGLDNREFAMRLGLAVRSVKFHATNTLAKLGRQTG
jgi:DNA-binding NarL/FixJ family response regulator